MNESLSSSQDSPGASLLMLQFLEWVSAGEHSYAETMEAWRSNCPRQAVWDDALLEGLIQIEVSGPLKESLVSLTAKGREKIKDQSARPT